MCFFSTFCEVKYAESYPLPLKSSLKDNIFVDFCITKKNEKLTRSVNHDNI